MCVCGGGGCRFPMIGPELENSAVIGALMISRSVLPGCLQGGGGDRALCYLQGRGGGCASRQRWHRMGTGPLFAFPVAPLPSALCYLVSLSSPKKMAKGT